MKLLRFNTFRLLHPYDNALAWSSLWILYAVYFIDENIPYRVPLKILMLFQTFISVYHWVRYEEDWKKILDVVVSQCVFIFHIILVLFFGFPKNQENKKICYTCGALSIILFYINTLLLKCRQKAIKGPYSLWHLLPHPTFRFFAFWFVMIIHGQCWSWIISIIYYVTLIAMGFPRMT